MTTPAQIAELRALMAKATPGEWRAGTEFINSLGFECVLIECGPVAVDDAICVASAWADGEEDDEAKVNAAVIAALHNAAPALLATIDALTAERDRYRVALEWYANANYERGPMEYEHGQPVGARPSEVYDDAGTIARAALTPTAEGGRA